MPAWVSALVEREERRVLGRVPDMEEGQVARRLLIRGAVDAGVDDLLLHAGTEARVIKAQRLVLREKKPADRRGSC